jgi:hypothetical protein
VAGAGGGQVTDGGGDVVAPSGAAVERLGDEPPPALVRDAVSEELVLLDVARRDRVSP